MQTIAGRDELDSTSAFAPVPDYVSLLDGNVKGTRIGLPREYYENLSNETGDLILKGVDLLKKLGCEVREISLPVTKYAIALLLHIIATAEASSNLARYDGARYTIRAHSTGRSIRYIERYVSQYPGRGISGIECKRRIMLGTYVLSAGYYDAYYLKAQKVRALIADDFRRAFGEVDVIVTPVSPFPAFKIGEKIDDPMACNATPNGGPSSWLLPPRGSTIWNVSAASSNTHRRTPTPRAAAAGRDRDCLAKALESTRVDAATA